MCSQLSTCSLMLTGGAPASFYCPISMELMADPVMVATGHTYDRLCIERWLAAGNRTCPVTGMRLRHLELTPNFALRNAIQVSHGASYKQACCAGQRAMLRLRETVWDVNVKHAA